MSEPIVSIVMPTFNCVEYVASAFTSVHAQTFGSWELIVVDDGSDEETCEFLRSIPDSRTKVVFLAHTGNPAAVRNQGISLARGRYVAFLDSDDVWAPNKLERQVALMESKPTRRWSYTAVRKVDAAGRVLDDKLFSPWVPHSGMIIEQLLRFEASVAMPTVMVDLDLLKDLNGFDESMPFAEDYDLWLRLSMCSEVSVEPHALSDVRGHPGRYTADRIGGHKGWVSLFRKMENLMPSARLRALCRKRAGEHALLLAALQARQRDWAGMRCSLSLAAVARASNPRDWLRVVKNAVLSQQQWSPNS